MSLECLGHGHQITRHSVDHLIDRFALGHDGHGVLRWVPHFASPVGAALWGKGEAQPRQHTHDPRHDRKATVLGASDQHAGDLVVE